jgi:bacterioferritin-associated ferredoxin
LVNAGRAPAGKQVAMYVCVCHGITDRQIRRAVDQGAHTVGELQMHLPVGGCCGRCVDTAEAVINEHRQQGSCPPRAAVPVCVPALA